MHDWQQWLANGLPMLILVLLWIFFMGKWKGLPWFKLQEKQIELLEQQLLTLRQTNELLRKLVEAR
jgi:di/tricarboxylate transporter